jgi:serine/threonine protein kinase
VRSAWSSIAGATAGRIAAGSFRATRYISGHVVGPSILSEKYRVLAHVGTGATGMVYEAENLVTGRRVALKLLEKSALGGAAESERIFREARAAGQLESRHIAQVLDAGIDTERGATSSSSCSAARTSAPSSRARAPSSRRSP